MVAVILGTGTNACYVERLDAIPKLQGQMSSTGETVRRLSWISFPSITCSMMRAIILFFT